jgi:hypothetical protein
MDNLITAISLFSRSLNPSILKHILYTASHQPIYILLVAFSAERRPQSLLTTHYCLQFRISCNLKT